MTGAGDAAPRAAYRRDGALVSREAFYAAACDPRLSCVVEACAGAGKTWMLVSRILRALLDGALPQDILAITFTRKAAGEMRERLDQWLAEYASPATPDDALAQALRDRGMDAAAARQAVPALRGLHARVLTAGRPVEIRTFHAWFSQLLGAAPLELLDALGLRRDLALIEDESEHATDVFRRFHAAVSRDEALAEDYRALVERRGRSDARRWLEAAWYKRVELSLADEAGVFESSVPPATVPVGGCLPHPAEALQTPRWRSTIGELAELLAGGKNKTSRDAGPRLEAALECSDDPAEAPALFEALRAVLFTKTSGTPVKALGASPLLMSVCDELLQLADAVAQHEACLEHRRMVRLSRVLLAEYAAFKRQRGFADMADLERCALALLADPALAGWVQERLDLRVRHLLIDEFQDTSPLQWQALHGWLSSYAGAGGGASGQRPPGVFIVGDPKQSIYRFRRAEPRVFAAAREFVQEGLEGAVLACDHTRRNTPAVLAVLNPVFETAAAAGEYEGFRPHTTEVDEAPGPALHALPGVARPARAKATGGEEEAPVWRDTLSTPREEPEQVLREQEAERVAAAVAAWIDAGRLLPRDVLVLSRKRESLRLAARALQARRIACAQVEAATLMESPEVRDLVAVMDALVSPRHRLALAQALRSPLFGVDDADLLHLAERAAADGVEWWAALMQAANDEEAAAARPALARAARLLGSWREAAWRLPPHDLLDRIVAEGDAMRRYAAAVPSVRCSGALAAIDALLAQALLLDGGRYATPYGFVRALKRRVVKAELPAEPDAVQLLTIHGAKGLEARAVFLMDTDPEAPQRDRLTLLVDWPVESERPQCCAFVASEARCPPSLRDLLAREDAARAREDLNLLYVALTRARQWVVASHTQPSRPGDGTCWRVRVEAHAVPWAGEPAAASGGGEGADTPAYELRELPSWPGEEATGTGSDGRAAAAGDDDGCAAGVPAPRHAAAAEAAPLSRSVEALRRMTVAASGDPSARLGCAVHRLLEWATQGGEGALLPDDHALGTLAEAAATEYGVDPVETLRRGHAVLHSPACARFFAGAALRWAGNEVTVADDGEPLRIDRLVCLEAPGEPSGRAWWVLDYKLHQAPHSLDAYREQLLRYRAAVARLQPGETVRCAFVTGGGEVIEVAPEQELAPAG